MSVLVDTHAWIEYWKGGEKADDVAIYIDGNEEIIVSTINLLEIEYWLSKHFGPSVAKNKIQVIVKRSFVIEVDEEIAREASKIRIAYKLPLISSIILATAKKYKARIVTGDEKLKNFDEVIYIGD
jgi:predicted nucleic acid-binding protein